MRINPSLLCSVTILAGLALSAAGQTTGPQLPPLAGKSMYGPDLYRLYCATCHGRDGKGAGPAAVSLKVPPPDLTTLGRRRGGTFPRADVEAIIRGPATPSHGSAEMPIWGPIFNGLDPSQARNAARIDSLVSHLESIQQK